MEPAPAHSPTRPRTVYDTVGRPGGGAGRREPDSGEVNYPYLFAELDRRGYDGWWGCEYRPASRTEDGLGWARDYGIGG